MEGTKMKTKIFSIVVMVFVFVSLVGITCVLAIEDDEIVKRHSERIKKIGLSDKQHNINRRTAHSQSGQVILNLNTDNWFEVAEGTLTLNQLTQAGFVDSTHPGMRRLEVLCFDGVPASNIAPVTTYFMLNGSWHKVGGGSTPIDGNTLLPQYFIIRNTEINGNGSTVALNLPSNLTFYGGTVQNPATRPWGDIAQDYTHSPITNPERGTVSYIGKEEYLAETTLTDYARIEAETTHGYTNTMVSAPQLVLTEDVIAAARAMLAADRQINTADRSQVITSAVEEMLAAAGTRPDTEIIPLPEGYGTTSPGTVAVSGAAPVSCSVRIEAVEEPADPSGIAGEILQRNAVVAAKTAGLAEVRQAGAVQVQAMAAPENPTRVLAPSPK